MFEITCELGELKLSQRPGKTGMIAWLVQQRDDLLVIAVLVERKEQLALDSLGADRIRCQHNQKPIALRQCLSDLVVPLFGSDNVGGAIPV